MCITDIAWDEAHTFTVGADFRIGITPSYLIALAKAIPHMKRGSDLRRCLQKEA